MTIKIYKPSKSAMQSGVDKTKKWLAEYITDVDNIQLNFKTDSQENIYDTIKPIYQPPSIS